MAQVIRVKVKPRGYPVHVGYQILEDLPRLITKLGGSPRLFVVFDSNVAKLHGDIVRNYLRKVSRSFKEIIVPAGERSKSTKQLARLHQWLLESGVSRSDLLVAVGGGVISDLAGYAAATVLRGIRWGVISTSLLGMVDASIGGKTGINHSIGKNLIGAFWQPSFVLADTCFLHSLPQRHTSSGMGEVIKYAGLIGGNMIPKVSRLLQPGATQQPQKLSPFVAQSARIKAGVVEKDTQESGHRMILNLGHTFGHGIEASLGYKKLFHGEAVVLGIGAAIELSLLTGVARISTMAAYRELVHRYIVDLPKVKLSSRSVVANMRLDKKRKGDNLRFVLLKSPGNPIIVDGCKTSQVRDATARMLDVYHSTGGADA